jgi:hypothetical protein
MDEALKYQAYRIDPTRHTLVEVYQLPLLSLFFHPVQLVLQRHSPCPIHAIAISGIRPALDLPNQLA